jgi:pyruvate-formate lyase-activating enzyme
MNQRRVFPIQTATACKLKWAWSTVYLTYGQTSSCHRVQQHNFDTESFDFHNTPEKQQQRSAMLQGQWPTTQGRGCDYCRNIEQAGGQSDRLTNLAKDNIAVPPELFDDPTLTSVHPTLLEIYFDNLCNLKCVYCGPHFSSLWDAENRHHGSFVYKQTPFSKTGVNLLPFKKDPNIQDNKQRMFQWLKEHKDRLGQINILGGEPFYQDEYDQCLSILEQGQNPNLTVTVFTNLNISLAKLTAKIDKVEQLITQGKIKNFVITASLDCWGPAQEYVRYPLDLVQWERNFEYLLTKPFLNLTIGSTITPLTIKTLPDLLEKIKIWNQQRPVYWYGNSCNFPTYMQIDILGDLFQEDFDRAVSLLADQTVGGYLKGIARQAASKGKNSAELINLKVFLTEMDRRRSTNWRTTFPWLIDHLDSDL